MIDTMEGYALRVVSSREAVTESDWASQRRFLCGSDGQVGGLRDRERAARSVDTRDDGERMGPLGWVKPVPDAGELQANVSLANADNRVADAVDGVTEDKEVSRVGVERPKAKPASLWRSRSGDATLVAEAARKAVAS